jgi:hypothetical protein
MAAQASAAEASAAEEARRWLNEVDSALREVLSLTLNVAHGEAPPAPQAPAPGAAAQGAEQPPLEPPHAHAHAQRLAPPAQQQLPEQQQQLVDSLIANCKRVETYFASKAQDNSHAAVLREIAALEAELAVKDNLIADVTSDLGRWTAKPLH